MSRCAPTTPHMEASKRCDINNIEPPLTSNHCKKCPQHMALDIHVLDLSKLKQIALLTAKVNIENKYVQ